MVWEMDSGEFPPEPAPPLVLLEAVTLRDLRTSTPCTAAIINRNNRLKKLVDITTRKVIASQRKADAAQSVDALFDNNRCKRRDWEQQRREVADRHD